MGRPTSFYYSFLVLPAPKRRAILAIFDFCRAVDDSIDLEPDPRRARAQIARWRGEVSRLFSDERPETAQGERIKPVVEMFRLPREAFDALVDGVAMDADPHDFATFAELETYCHGVASAVGLICAEVFGYDDRAMLAYARDLGVALQLTNILRDVAVDLRRGRFYLPAEDLAPFGCRRADFEACLPDNPPRRARSRRELPEPVRAVLGRHAARAREYFARAAAALVPADARRFVAAEIMRAIYWDLLLRIERARFDVFDSVIRVPRPVQAAIAVRTWWRVR